jgi:NAD(P)-dependent dehydrogenase (short-subunit alcohol dehydrogenase family)
MAFVAMAGALANKIAFVTGSESGIGQAIAEEVARAGADVVITFDARKPPARGSACRSSMFATRTAWRRLSARSMRASAFPISSSTAPA